MFCGPFVSVGSGETFQHLVVPCRPVILPPNRYAARTGGSQHLIVFGGEIHVETRERERERAVIFSFILFPYLLVISLLAKDLYVGAKRTQLREKSVSKPPPETRATIR